MEPSLPIPDELAARRITLESQGLGAFADLVIEAERLAGLGRLSGAQSEVERAAEAAFETANHIALGRPGPLRALDALRDDDPAAASAVTETVERRKPEREPEPEIEAEAVPPALDRDVYFQSLGLESGARSALDRVLALTERAAADETPAREALAQRLGALEIDAAAVLGEAAIGAERARAGAEETLAQEETAAAWLAEALSERPELNMMRAGAAFADCAGGRSAIVLDAAYTARLQAQAQDAALSPGALMRAWLSAED
ncbi:MAG: hypothetical protein AAGM38_03140 [Pseudomonadota bacterium]